MLKNIFMLMIFYTAILHATITLTNEEQKYDHFSIHYYYDESNSLDIHDIQKKNFTTVIKNQFSQGYRSGTSWFKIDIKNDSDHKEFILYFTEPFWSQLDFYTKNQDSWHIQKNGLDIPLKERSIQSLNPSYKIKLLPNEHGTYYIKGHSLSGHIGEFKILTQEEFFRPSRISITDVYIIYLCILCTIIIFSLYSLLIIKHRIFAYYIAYLISFILFIHMKSGFYLTLGFTGWSEGLHTIGTLVVLFLVLFSAQFLELKQRMPMIHKIFMLSAAVFLLFSLLISQNLPYTCLVFNIYSSFFFVLLLVIAIKSWYQSIIGVRFYLIALIIYMPTMALMTLTFNGIVENTDISRYAFLVGSFLEIIFFTLILTSKYNTLNLQKIYEQKQLIKEKKHHEKVLESEIKQKTKDLVHINKQLLKKTQELEKAKDDLTKDIHNRIEAENEVKKQKNILQYQADHDPLTGLSNRSHFATSLQQGIEIAKKEKRNLAIFFIDLDKFKEINDSLGHDVGDKVLITVSNILKHSIRKGDTLARLAGDEFTIIMEDLMFPNDASSLAQDILRMFSEPIYIDNHALYLTCSIGISLYPQDADNEKDLLKYADTAMYIAKENGRNNFQFYLSEMTTSALEQMKMKSSLRQAIDTNEFIVHYQPQVNQYTNKIIGIEALVRWKHSTKGLLTPKKFLALAEETGMIKEIDQYVMDTAMKQILQWYQNGLNPGVLSLNISMKQLEDENFLSKIKEKIRSYGFKAEWLEFEITEGHMMKNPMTIINTLRQINDLGISISIDDFGTGYSSLSLLKRLPIDKLKIDKSFIQDIPEDEEDIAIINSIIALAKSLNLTIVAEGVETKQQIDFLMSKHCRYVQGHYYFHPLSAEELENILSKENDSIQ